MRNKGNQQAVRIHQQIDRERGLHFEIGLLLTWAASRDITCGLWLVVSGLFSPHRGYGA